MKYKKGDIVFASRYNYPDGQVGNRHLFIVIAVLDDGKLEVLSDEYLSLIISSKREKGNDVSDYTYNQPLDKNDINNLRDDSIVKCDAIFVIDEKHITKKIGEVTDDEFNKYIELLERAIK